MWVFSTAGCRWLGAAGSLAVTAGGWAAGTLPVRGGAGLWQPHGTGVTVAGSVVASLGLTLLIVAWWQYGRVLRAERAGATGGGSRGGRGGVTGGGSRGGRGGATGGGSRGGRGGGEGAGPGVGGRGPLVTLGWWIAPLLLAPPLYSADVYSYIAQGAMVLEGHDVYGAGPAVLAPGELGHDAAASVGGHWTDTPAPYGPVFLLLAQAVVAVTGGAVVPAVLGMRLVALLALALIAWAVRGLAPEGRRDGALWLAALNPLVIVHVVGGMHNDGLMAGLLLAGVLLAGRRGRWWPVAGGAVIGLAMMVKSPAALGLLFVGIVVARRRGGVAGLAKGLLPGAVAVAVAALASVAAGTGFGWLRTQGVAANIHTALSVTSDLGLGLGLLVADDPDPVKGVVQKLGLLAAGAIVATIAWRVAKGRLDPVLGLGVALLALVALSPMVQPWYALWGTVVVAAAGAWDGRGGQLLAVLCAALTYETAPSGHTPAYGFALAGVVLAAGVFWARRESWGEPAAAPGGAPVPGPRPVPGGAVSPRAPGR
ncbi:polyprenol phosphomannose-dependent alpha 1,6 mannosyltransferase MptB [Streptomyces roseicoloratus]|uniref:Polyprenol phosphomannose-dependent alpha 1,6 mannosyltransferase MptB n=1 Tax=Streptomyces roseicoloratus TaxID=2508722 RepID=A0ABY9RT11_9ACTN|nr:polyprenol phosphomannose-dependent alpha 1,6 mannosyltransferase MptB [Streptomyces roseicoloratus]WMX45310.1 polyprenol phosphomannose-dependent alpha 1,6 mannosyltransferase MptB [Streptomyces roseicoloratus]